VFTPLRLEPWRVQVVTGDQYPHGRLTGASGTLAESHSSRWPCARIRRVEAQPIVVPPGQGHRLGNVEFLARTADTPRFTFGIIEIVAGRALEAHVHADEDDAFYILEGEMTFTFGDEEVTAPPGTFVLVPPGVEHGFHNDGDGPVRMLNIHAPAGFDRRIGLKD
jgi:mannose-6-phosphate isomerase-like protein (cupin superfamily)